MIFMPEGEKKKLYHCTQKREKKERARKRERTTFVLFVSASSREVVSECQYGAEGRRSSEMRVQLKTQHQDCRMERKGET